VTGSFQFSSGRRLIYGLFPEWGLAFRGVLSYRFHLILIRISMIRAVGSELVVNYTKRSVAMADYDEELDATGLNCPLPILRAKKALNGMETGKVLRIIATDPGSVKDFEAFAKQTGNELMSSTEEGGKFMFLMRKG
jgi:tRNA 2-thiouridine synthesizing protein A